MRVMGLAVMPGGGSVQLFLSCRFDTLARSRAPFWPSRSRSSASVPSYTPGGSEYRVNRQFYYTMHRVIRTLGAIVISSLIG